MTFLFRMLLLTAGVTSASACATIFGVDDRDVSIVLFAEAAHLPATLRVDVAGRTHVLEGPGERRAAAPDGTHAVEVSLTARGAAPVATSFDMGFGEGRHHWVHVFVGRQRPLGDCSGTLAALPVGVAGDSAFVAYGSIQRDALC